MRILVCELAFRESRDAILPYAYGALRAYIEEFEIELSAKLNWLHPVFRWPLESKSQIDFSQVDVFCLSCYVWNFESQMRLASEFKEINPDGIVIAGGPHIECYGGDFQIQNGKNSAVDFWIYKEGEAAFARILNAVSAEGATAVKRPERRRAFEEPLQLPHLPTKSPYLSNYYQSMTKSHGAESLTALWETARGCPFNCSFCNWGSYTSTNVRPLDLDRLRAEAEWFGQNKIHRVYITDANFGILPRDEELAEALAATKRQYGWPKEVWANYNKNTTDRVFRINQIFIENRMSYSGATISVQSMNEETLEAISRKNIGFKRYVELAEKNEAHELTSYTELILGLPGETLSSFRSGIDRLVETGVRNIRMYPALVLPNTDFSNSSYQSKYGILSTKKKLYLEQHEIGARQVIERAEVITETKTISQTQMKDLYRFAYLTQTLHCAGFTRILFQSMLQGHQCFSQFIDGLFSMNEELIHRINELCLKMIDIQFDTDQTNMFGVQYLDFEFDRRRDVVRGAPWNLLWLTLMLNKDEFYSIVMKYIRNQVAVNPGAAAFYLDVQSRLLFDFEVWKTGRREIEFGEGFELPIAKLKFPPGKYLYSAPPNVRRESLNDYLYFATGSTVITAFKYLIPFCDFKRVS